MKKITILPAFLFGVLLLSAQTTVTNASFPVAGDTLKTVTDPTPSGIEITMAGGPFQWDFSGLTAGAKSESIFLDASEGSIADEVPTATHVVINEALGGETYFQITADEVGLIGVNGNDPTGFGLNAFFRFTPPIIQRRAPMAFPSNNASESNLLIAMAWSDLPPILTDSIPLPVAPDSLRVRITSNRNDFVDAYGTLDIPGGSYETLREKRTTITERRVDAYTGFFGWTDITDLLAGGFAGLGTDTTITYDFFSDDAKETIASVIVDIDDNPISVTFKDNGVLTSDREEINPSPIVSISPNPVSDFANFNFKNFPAGEYMLTIIGIKGNIVSQQKLLVSGAQNEKINTSHFADGNYFYQILNEQGKNISFGKLIKH